MTLALATIKCIKTANGSNQKIMGNWAITIIGHGLHHNDSFGVAPVTDANLAAADFVAHLCKIGQHIEKATFTYGGKEELTPTSISVIEPKVSCSG